ncbi:PREDICTED: uncharacterized protein LOC106807839 [Priapulus caudatus]|uniref:Uncharacterized protein LOC106807839 n=1 Tax=Priapulus caudatus TaxID=37621 RepID=A0ABM1E0S2_PRICU|nr:PREDICTED: uncharacterized protein LOC106807839 [Priapulus caudatus]XP_014665793.1 PREDICTED: uncharacterized protein LOC106807839 [Priapulus caudatus]XP_014665794.1 PREDICTED: uncharacterized protein LOC106807839 [Priapulus caudatus]
MYLLKVKKRISEKDEKAFAEKAAKYQERKQVQKNAAGKKHANGSSSPRTVAYEDLPDGAFFSRSSEPRATPTDTSCTWRPHGEERVAGICYVGSFSVVGADTDTRADHVRLQMAELQRQTTSAAPVTLLISLSGIKVCAADSGALVMAHALRRISYASCDPPRRQFSFLAREPKGHYNMQYCHCFATRSPEQAETLDALVGRVFRLAYLRQVNGQLTVDHRPDAAKRVDSEVERASAGFRALARLVEDSEGASPVAGHKGVPLTDGNANHCVGGGTHAGRDTTPSPFMGGSACHVQTFQNARPLSSDAADRKRVSAGSPVTKGSRLLATHARSLSLDSDPCVRTSSRRTAPILYARSASTETQPAFLRAGSPACIPARSGADARAAFVESRSRSAGEQLPERSARATQTDDVRRAASSRDVGTPAKCVDARRRRMDTAQGRGSRGENSVDRVHYAAGPSKDREASSVPRRLAPLPPSDSEPESDHPGTAVSSCLIGYEEPMATRSKMAASPAHGERRDNEATIVQTYTVTRDGSTPLVQQPLRIQQARDNPSYLRETTPPPPRRVESLASPPVDDDDRRLRDAWWFQAGIPREVALELLSREPLGAFIVRGSTTRAGCYALSVRVPRDHTGSGIAHYLVLRRDDCGGYRIRGFPKEFPSLTALITHHSVLQELLPCPLLLSRSNPLYIHSDSADTVDSAHSGESSDYNRFAEFRQMMTELKVNGEISH